VERGAVEETAAVGDLRRPGFEMETRKSDDYLLTASMDSFVKD
jgi:hypothetical protein